MKRTPLAQGELGIPELCYRHKTAEAEVTTAQTFTPVVKMEFDDGVLSYLQGAAYPNKGITNPEAMAAINLSKRTIVQWLRLLSKWWFFPTWAIFVLVPFKVKLKIMNRMIDTFTNATYIVVKPFVLQAQYMTPICREIEWWCYSFMEKIGIDSAIADRVSEVLAASIDYDNAYRFRIGDIFSETTKEKLLENPGKEIARLTKIAMERNNHGYVQWYNENKTLKKNGKYSDMALKFKFMGFAIRMLLLNSKVKKAFKATLKDINFEFLGLDEADRYWCCLRADGRNEYLFFGKTDEERMKMLEGVSKPVLIKM